ncbi:transporter substrate-binding domain-containing protein [Thalassospira sp.]|uniref:substrate-binding periplasmic protein n=1 Tax=Thalassospira sp. TaxID=1912094 RepID=UPI00311E163E
MIALIRYAVVLMIALFAPTIAGANHKLVITTNIYPPYVRDDVEESFLPALFEEIGKEMGVTFVLNIQPWKRCEQSVADLEAWGTFPYTRTPERDARFLFSDPIYFSESRFFAYHDPNESKTNQPPETYDQLSDLKPWIIGGIQGYYYEPLFAQTGLNTDYALSERQNFERLMLGRIDLFPAATTVGWHLINQMFPAEVARNFRTLDPPLVANAPLHLMTSKDYPNTETWLVRFNEALLTIHQNGTFARLVEKYGLVMRY